VLRISRVIILTRAAKAKSSPHETFCIFAIRLARDIRQSLSKQLAKPRVKLCKVSQN